ncbi:hypothetical protein [Bradyrhizobium sp. cf659]|uniref:hypothetical protein n=1 Tax=Bradyrhizobium sp. cf659 TaxID=1761771 RepID=UPI0008F033BD|nr:hypothetical protein [Bradyrhizobium sp. cf659]SFH91959.1 hypothetical protein SAMN04487925_1011126 [Bradyrhizobium sp. cf659]
MISHETRLKALARLARSQTEGAKLTLREEVAQASKILISERNYGPLRSSLDVLEAIGHRLSAETVDVLGTFVRTVEHRDLQYPAEELAVFGSGISKYQNSQTLVVRAIEVLITLRYLETRSVLQIFLGLTRHASEQVQRKALEALSALADYNIEVFYGRQGVRGIGARPQQVVIDELAQLSDVELASFSMAALALSRSLLSPTMEANSWSFETVTLSRGATPAVSEVPEIRRRAIQLLERLYGLVDSISERLAVIDALHDATRRHDTDSLDSDASKMIVRDTSEVLTFYERLIGGADLQIVQRIESHSYWTYFHAGDEKIREKALCVEREIAQNHEYQIYRVLIGFEGVFGDWSELVKSERDFSAIEQMRKQAASQYAATITSANYDDWRSRIIAFAKTESNDLATFPIFYHFLEEFAKQEPELALRLVQEDLDAVERFLIPLLRGLWVGPRHDATRDMIEMWIDRAAETGGRHLFVSTKLFLSNEEFDLDLLKRLLGAAERTKEVAVVRQVVSVAITNFREGGMGIVDQLFLPAIAVLTREDDAGWIFDAWFRRELRDLLAALDERSADAVLRNLLSLPRVDYHAEEVLCAIARVHPTQVISYFGDRIDISLERRSESRREFEAVPFDFHKLQEPLSTIPREAIRLMRESFEKDRALFQFLGGRLLKNIFPKFSSEFEAGLLELVSDGGDDNYSFVLGVLRNYEGQPIIHRICREIVREISVESPLRSEVVVVLEATGVVSGRFGFADSYERKRVEMLEWLSDPDDRVRDFAEGYISRLERMRDSEKERAEEEIALDKFRYGEPPT